MKTLLKTLCIISFIGVVLSMISCVFNYTNAPLTFYLLLTFTISSAIYVIIMASEEEQFESKDNWFNYEKLEDEDFHYHPDRE